MKPLNMLITGSQGKLLRKSFPRCPSPQIHSVLFFLAESPHSNKVVTPRCLRNKQDIVPSGKRFGSRPSNVSYLCLVHLLYIVSLLVVVTSHSLTL